jgi:TetR/AcrR family transcriptional regulator
MNAGPEIDALYQPLGRVRSTTIRKREQIVEAAMRHFAERGYEGTHVQAIATELGIAKGSIFQHFGSKEGLFLAAYRRAILSFDRYLDAPGEVTRRGFFATIRYWLDRTEHLVREDWVPYRVALLGAHGSDLAIKREINRFLAAEDPYGTADFVRSGLERGEIRTDIDEGMLVAMVDWLMERFQDALVTEELDPGLFQRRGSRVSGREARIEQFVELLRSAIGVRGRSAVRRSSR